MCWLRDFSLFTFFAAFQNLLLGLKVVVGSALGLVGIVSTVLLRTTKQNVHMHHHQKFDQPCCGIIHQAVSI